MASLATLHPQLRPYAELLVRVAELNGLRVSVNSTLRTRAQQAILYQRYLEAQRTGARGVLPANPPGTSDHELGLAFDLTVNGDYRSAAQAALGSLWRSWGGVWAGAADPVHFGVRH
jgi:LAS superfamily LD-carboxypeptidase LdcB